MKIEKSAVLGWIGLCVLAGIAGLAGYGLGQYLGGVYPRTQFAAAFPSLNNKVAIGLAGLSAVLILLYGISALFYGLATIIPKWAEARAISDILGSGRQGRQALAPIAAFYGAYALMLAGLWVLDLRIGGAGLALFWIMSIVLCGGVVVWACWRLWFLMDELFKRIWVEAMALTSLLTLVGVIIAQALLLGGLVDDLHPLAGIIVYQALYLVINLLVTAHHAPDVLRPHDGDAA